MFCVPSVATDHLENTMGFTVAMVIKITFFTQTERFIPRESSRNLSDVGLRSEALRSGSSSTRCSESETANEMRTSSRRWERPTIDCTLFSGFIQAVRVSSSGAFTGIDITYAKLKENWRINVPLTRLIEINVDPVDSLDVFWLTWIKMVSSASLRGISFEFPGISSRAAWTRTSESETEDSQCLEYDLACLIRRISTTGCLLLVSDHGIRVSGIDFQSSNSKGQVSTSVTTAVFFPIHHGQL